MARPESNDGWRKPTEGDGQDNVDHWWKAYISPAKVDALTRWHPDGAQVCQHTAEEVYQEWQGRGKFQPPFAQNVTAIGLSQVMGVWSIKMASQPHFKAAVEKKSREAAWDIWNTIRKIGISVEGWAFRQPDLGDHSSRISSQVTNHLERQWGTGIFSTNCHGLAWRHAYGLAKRIKAKISNGDWPGIAADNNDVWDQLKNDTPHRKDWTDQSTNTLVMLDAIRALPPIDRCVIEKRLEDWDYASIAKWLNIRGNTTKFNAANVRQIYGRACQKMANHLADEDH